MKILTLRNPSSPKSTQGEILINDLHHSWSLEPADSYINPEGHQGPIPCGVYKIEMVIPSEKFQNEFKPPITKVPQFLNVPDRQAVYCHPGNEPKDTQSCILPGFEHSLDFVGNSRPAFADICAKIEQAELHGIDVEWTIRYA